jgi:8-oxo-dGTP diphosphatase
MPIKDQGPLSDRYSMIPRVLIFITRGNFILLIKGAAHKKIWAGLYNAIGGHIEQGENVYHSARRELFEETGLRIDQLWLCGVVSIDTHQNPGIMLFIMRGETQQVELTASSEGEPGWFSLDKLDYLPLVEDMPILLAKIMRLQPGDPPIFGTYRYTRDGALSIEFD